MKPKYLMIAAPLLLLCAVCAFLLPIVTAGNADDDLCVQEPVLFFSSFEAFEAHKRTTNQDEITCYYIPANLTDSFTFSQINTRENTYVTVSYSLNPTGLVTEDMDSDTKERMTQLTCTYSVFTVIPGDCKEIEYHGRTIHYKREYKDTSSGKILAGYDIYFFEGDHQIEMHLPPLDTLENMLQYTEVIKVNIA